MATLKDFSVFARPAAVSSIKNRSNFDKTGERRNIGVLSIASASIRKDEPKPDRISDDISIICLL